MAALSRGKRLYYTTPLKALSNQKLADLRTLFGESNVGLLTGDASINPDAPVVVMTTEILRNILYSELVDKEDGADDPGQLAAMPEHAEAADAAHARSGGRPSRLDNVAFVVMDEVHYISDADRGTAWEESIIYMPRSVQMVCLSATVSNPHELVAWMERVHGPTELVTTDWRPVPLRWHFSSRSAGSLRAARRRADNAAVRSGRPKEGRRTGRFGGGGARRRRRGGAVPALPDGDGLLPLFEYKSQRPSRQIDALMAAHAADPPEDAEDLVPSVGVTLRQLRERDMLPAVWFIFSRFGCERAAAFACDETLVTDEERATLERALADFDAANPDAAREGARKPLLNGVAAHHAGMLPVWKRFVEEQFIAGRLKCVFSTETLAAGLNMPARTAVLHTISKRTGARTHAPLGGNALLQMAGRAGRRGKDTLGHVVVRQSPFEGPEAAINVLHGGAEPMSSQFAVSYGMVLSLLRRLSPRRAKALLERSFGNYLGGEGRRKAVVALEAAEARLREAVTEAHAVPEYVCDEAWQAHGAANGRLKSEERALQALEAQCKEAAAAARGRAALDASLEGGGAVLIDLTGLDGAPQSGRLPGLLVRASSGGAGAAAVRTVCLGADGNWYDVCGERLLATMPFTSAYAETAPSREGVGPEEGIGATEAALGAAAGDFRRVGMLRGACPGDLSFSWTPIDGAPAGAPCWQCTCDSRSALGRLTGVEGALCELEAIAAAAGSGADAGLDAAVEEQQARVVGASSALAELENAQPELREGAQAAKRASAEARDVEVSLPALRARVAAYGSAGWAEFIAHVDVLEAVGALSRAEAGEATGGRQGDGECEEQWRLSPMGENAARLRGANAVLLGLALAPGTNTERASPAEGLSAGALAGFVAALVSADSVGGRVVSSAIPPSDEVLLALQALEASRTALQRAQDAHGVSSSTELDLRLVGCVEAWASGIEWKEVMGTSSGLDEGDMARVLRRVRELLLQLPSLPFVDTDIVRTARAAADAMERAPIANMVE